MLPSPVETYLRGMSIEARAPAFLRVSHAGQIIEFGGAMARYGLATPTPGARVADFAPFLDGLLPLAGRSATLRWIELVPGTAADVHLIAGADDDWVLLLDSTDDAKQRQRFQQVGNELRLAHDQLAARVKSLEAENAALRLQLDAIRTQ